MLLECEMGGHKSLPVSLISIRYRYAGLVFDTGCGLMQHMRITYCDSDAGRVTYTANLVKFGNDWQFSKFTKQKKITFCHCIIFEPSCQRIYPIQGLRTAP